MFSKLMGKSKTTKKTAKSELVEPEITPIKKTVLFEEEAKEPFGIFSKRVYKGKMPMKTKSMAKGTTRTMPEFKYTTGNNNKSDEPDLSSESDKEEVFNP